MRKVPQVNRNELAQFASVWRRGTHLFKQAYEQGSIDPTTHVHTYTQKDVTDPMVAHLIERCNIKKLVAFIQHDATPKTERNAYFTGVFCLGQEALKLEEEQHERETVP